MKYLFLILLLSCSSATSSYDEYPEAYEAVNEDSLYYQRDLSHHKNNQITLLPMFNKNSAFICTKGVMAGPGRSHNTANSKYAIDLQMKKRSPIRSVFTGTAVVKSGCRNRKSRCGHGFGNFVKVLSKSGYVAFYSHLKKVSVRTGQKVKAGQIIGYEGKSGNASGPHTHFSIHHSWKKRGYKAHVNSPVLLPPSINFNLNLCASKNDCHNRVIKKASDLTCRTHRLVLYYF